jgi:hypothetical protein
MLGCAIIASAFGLALVMPAPTLADGREEAVAAVERFGGRVEFERGAAGREVGAVFLTGGRVADRDLGLLAAFPELKRLTLTDSAVTDAGLKEVGRLSKLESLYLQDTAVTDAGLVPLKRLRRLSGLNLSGTRVTDRGWLTSAGCGGWKCSAWTAPR